MSDRNQPPHPNAICGRADLVRALMHGDDALLAAVARCLGYERPDRSLEPVVASLASPLGSLSAVLPAAGPPEIAPHPLLPAQFWLATALRGQSAAPPTSLPDGPVTLPDWSARPTDLAHAPPLAQWHVLLPQLRRIMAAPAETRTLDLPVIVRQMGRGESLSRLPRRRRPRWGLSLHLIEDRSDHLAPYWDDQERVRHQLARLFPRHTFEHALWFEGLRAPVWAAAARRRDPYRLPPPGSLVVVLGDLGCLLRGGGAQRRRWRALGRRLRAERCRTLALTPAPCCPEALEQEWRLLRWERLPPQRDPTARAAVVQRLLALAGNTLRLEPGLLRGLRLLIGADAGAESEVWQDRTVIGRSVVAATLSPDAAPGRRRAFLAEPETIRRQALALQRDWRAGLPSEIWLAELQALAPAERARLAGASDVRDSREFIAALGRQAAGVRGASPVPGALPWFRDAAPWLQGDYLDDPELGDFFYAIWAEILRRDAQQQPPPGLRPERLPPGDQPARRVTLLQRGATLCARYGQAADGHPGFLAQIESVNGVIRLDDARAAFWEGAEPPPWADDWGWDTAGAWSAFGVPAADGGRITQRLRWIAPGRCRMGSPPDEPGRLNNESPRRQVTIADGYWLFDTPCTQALWAAVMGTNPSRFKSPERPVEQVSWADVQGFLTRLNALVPGLELALPSEAQWEHACRAGTETALYAGPIAILGANNAPALDPIAWYGGNSGVGLELANGYDSSAWPEQQYPHPRSGTHPVARKQANAWGLYDMLGNVQEWVADPWHPDYQGAPADGSVWASTDAGAARVVRGRSWGNDARYCRCAFRGRYAPADRDDTLGFRCARVQVSEPGKSCRPAAERARLLSPGPRSGGGRAAAGSAGPAGEAVPGPVVLRLDQHGTAAVALPRVPRIEILTDRERLTLRRIPRPDWAGAMGRDRYGLWAEIAVAPEGHASPEPVIQRLRWCPPGRFLMGSPPDEPGRRSAEGSQHPVTIAQGFWLFDTPCTQALWEAVMGRNSSRFKHPDRPVEQVKWTDTQGFLERLNGWVPGLALVLPTEAQWEHACRAGTATALYSGPIEILGKKNAPALDPSAWYGGNSGVEYDLAEAHPTTGVSWKEMQYETKRAGTRRVKTKQPNAWGLYDMLGNVWEWCADGLRDYAAQPAIDPIGSLETGAARVVRGGSWNSLARDCRCAFRYGFAPAVRDADLGFRCARVQET